MPLTIIAALVAGLLGLWALTEGEEEAAAPRAASVETIARRVEDLRALRFTRLPSPVTVGPRQAQREGLANLDRFYPAARRRADEQIYALLGLVEPGTDLREIGRSLFGEGVAGYYDPRDGRLRVVEGAGTGTRVVEEMVLAHELTHALEDQRFGLPTQAAATDDRELARSALIEGTATSLMSDYVQRHFTTGEALGGLLGSALEDTGDLPPFLEAQLLFAYLGGERFVADLRRRGGWPLVDTAFRLRVPVSTEQVLHPRAYLSADVPRRVRLRAAAVLGDGWSRARAGTWGELQTRELLGSAKAAAGWGGDRYELWRSAGSGAGMLVMRWRWDTARDAGEFAAALREWAAGRSGTVAARRGGEVTLAVADDSALARRVASGA